MVFQYNKRDHIETSLYYGAIAGVASAVTAFGIFKVSPLVRLKLITNIPKNKQPLFILAAGLSGFAWEADNISRRFEWELYRPGAGYEQVHLANKAAKNKDFNGESVLDWAQENAFKVVLGSWGVSLVGCGLWLHYQPMTPQQKFAQARMYAQILAVALVVCAAFAASMPSSRKKDKHADDEAYEEKLFLNRKSTDNAKPTALKADDSK